MTSAGQIINMILFMKEVSVKIVKTLKKAICSVVKHRASQTVYTR